jgi:cobalt/nickel transport system permease protein
MHIPDGYLSPTTCAVMYGGAAPFWFVALKRVQQKFSAQFIPLLSLLSAFSFVVMMFNLPLPGGTTGHAVGMAIATIILGPWASILAISVALLIQAVFFGDGGITAYGANCFNMAVVGSLIAYAVYRAVAGRTPLQSPRRVIAAALAGYIAINASALCAAIEFGIQPALFHDASGAPLYAPYPLAIAIPAMLIVHLSFAGLAELVISGGLIAWLQRSDVSLLKTTAPGAAESDGTGAPAISGWVALRPLWIGLAALMIATPLGLLAAGTAWGEWGAEDFKNPEARQQIAAASHNIAPPENPPAGLEKLSSIWVAPMPGYAPTFIKSEQLGYILSAMFGTGLIIFTCLLAGWIMRLNAKRHDGKPAA